MVQDLQRVLYSKCCCVDPGVTSLKITATGSPHPLTETVEEREVFGETEDKNRIGTTIVPNFQPAIPRAPNARGPGREDTTGL
jgi:hypothetical protein